MARYTSHIYAEPTTELLSLLKSEPAIQTGLFHIRELGYYDTRYIVKDGLPKNGLVIIREMSDVPKAEKDSARAKDSRKNDAPIVSWHYLKSQSNVQVILPPALPTYAFGTIRDNDRSNPIPPIDFLRYLKDLSIKGHAKVAFYHYYTAYEGRLANAEYAWIFGDKDKVFVRYIDGRNSITCYSADDKQQLSISKNEDQPILKLVMDYFSVTLRPETYFRPEREIYFTYFNWNNYRLSNQNNED